MHSLDLAIVAFAAVGLLGLALALRARAGRDLESYFLGDRKLRWWMLGASGMASNVDMAGTMLIASLLFVFGLNGFWIELRGGVVLIMAFYLAFMGKWTRRSGCMTVAEWMAFRFGPEQGKLPRILSAAYNVVFFVWAMAFFTLGAERFFEALFPGPAHWWSIGLIVFVMLYTALSGLPGVVWTDVVLAGLFLFLAVYLSWTAFTQVDPTQLGPEWRTLTPAWQIDPPAGYEDYSLLGLLIVFYFAKTAIDGMSGAGGYLAQRYFAARDERACGLLSLCWIGLMTFRWPLIAAIALLGLSMPTEISSPELVLPVVLREHLPIGLRGVMVAGLLGAAMSTYSSFINAGISYLTRDLYQPLLRPKASARELVWVSYAGTLLLTGLGLQLAYASERINDLWDWINMGLGAGLIIPNAVRWYWWRMTGWGYAAGTATGLVAAFAIQGMDLGWSSWQTFTAISAASLFAIVVVSLLTRPIDPEILQTFYERTRPFGWWGPQRTRLDAASRSALRAEHRRDGLALVSAVPWQLALFLLPMTLLVRAWDLSGACLLVLLLSSCGLYFFWYRHLPGPQTD